MSKIIDRTIISPKLRLLNYTLDNDMNILREFYSRYLETFADFGFSHFIQISYYKSSLELYYSLEDHSK